MNDENPQPVVVAVGHDSIESALAFAVDEARHLGCGVHLVHAEHLVHDGPEAPFFSETEPERHGREVLTAALARARCLAGEDITLTSEVLAGAPVPALAARGADAHMIVLEHRDLSSLKRVITRSVASGVAARAQVPVVSVPAGWRPRTTRAESTVTVGVDVPQRSELILRTALRMAATRGARLHLLHAWTLPRVYEDIGVSDDNEQRWARRTTAEIQLVLDTLGDPADVGPVRIDVRHAAPADALVEASHETDLLVVGRHDPLVPLGSHLGPVARAVLRDAACPVLLAASR